MEIFTDDELAIIRSSLITEWEKEETDEDKKTVKKVLEKVKKLGNVETNGN